MLQKHYSYVIVSYGNDRLILSYLTMCILWGS